MKRPILIVLIVLLITTLSYNLYDGMNKPKTGYISLQEVFNSFDMKKEYEKKLTATKNSRKKLLDSLEMELKILGKKIQSDNGKNKEDLTVFSVKRDDFLEKKKVQEEDNKMQTKKYDQEILTQLNQYVRDYGKENNYTYIFGNDGNGSLMYAKETKEITKEITNYINEKYRGIK
ncbi:MAG TPA: OmpH family outer membrane protein [Bacteroidia bacterium]|jgi:outer membrane protein|nr:OmpH family outer membrane protein [Bacteroidia bacterium]